MIDPAQRITDIREELDELKATGIRSEINTSSIDQQLDRIESLLKRRANDRARIRASDNMPEALKARINTRLDRVEDRIKQAKRKL